MPAYNRADIYFEHGEGAYPFNGKGAVIAVASLGHCRPHRVVTEAQIDEAFKIIEHAAHKLESAA